MAEHRLFTEAQRCEREAARWQERAALALRHDEPELARQALGRSQQANERAIQFHALYREQAAAVRTAKTAFGAGRSSPDPSLERQLERLELEDRLERDLAALKASLTS